MKKFEEELEQLKNNSHTNFYGYMGIRLLTEPEIIETFKDWVSPEDHQQVAKALGNTTDKLAIAVDALTEIANDTCSVSVDDFNTSDVGVSGTFAAQALEKIGDVPEIFLRQAFAEMLEG